MMRGLNIPGAPSVPGMHQYQNQQQPAEIDPSLHWQFSNIVDKGMMGRAAVRVLEGSDLKIGVPSLNILSCGIQQHLKTILEGAFKHSKSRANRTAVNSYEGK